MLSKVSPLLNGEDVSYDVEYLFTKISIKNTIEYSIEQIYTH